MLAAAEGIEALPGDYSDKTFIHDVCANINKRNYAAQMSGRDSVGMFSRIFFKGKGRMAANAVILDCRAKGIVVLVLKFGVESFIRLVDNDSDDAESGAGQWEFDEQEFEFTRTSNGRKLCIFDEIRVSITVEERKAYREELVLKLMEVDDKDSDAQDHRPVTKRLKKK